MKGFVYKETMVLLKQYGVFWIEIMWGSTLRQSVSLCSKRKIFAGDTCQFALEMTVACSRRGSDFVCNRGCSTERVMTEHQTGENEAMHLKKTKQLTKKKCSNTEFKKTQRQRKCHQEM